MTKGVILLAYGKVEYISMAAQLAASIKHYSPDLPISLLHDEAVHYLPERYKQFFDKFITVKAEHLLTNGKIDPGKAKCNLINYLPYDLNLYLDVDGLCLQDLTPLFDTEKDFQTEVIGEGTHDDVIDYSHWATNEDAYTEFKLPKDRVFRTTQTSTMLFRKGAFTKKLQKGLDKCWSFPIAKLKNRWGAGLPDELIYSGALAQLDYDPSFGKQIVFFGHKYDKRSLTELQETYYILSMYGNGGSFSLVKEMYKDWYNRLNDKIHQRGHKMNKIRPIQFLMKGKHVG